MAPISNPADQTAPSARDRILQTAQILFYRDGVRATGVDRLIAEAGVTKVTFYRHFPSKDLLIEAFLDMRDDAWMEGFRRMIAESRDAQSPDQRRTAPLAPVLRAVTELVSAPTFRGCAFANTVAEVGGVLPSVLTIAKRHKRAVCETIASLLPEDTDRDRVAWAATLALDGTVSNTQLSEGSTETALSGFATLLDALTESIEPRRRADTPSA